MTFPLKNDFIDLNGPPVPADWFNTVANSVVPMFTTQGTVPYSGSSTVVIPLFNFTVRDASKAGAFDITLLARSPINSDNSTLSQRMIFSYDDNGLEFQQAPLLAYNDSSTDKVTMFTITDGIGSDNKIVSFVLTRNTYLLPWAYMAYLKLLHPMGQYKIVPVL